MRLIPLVLGMLSLGILCGLVSCGREEAGSKKSGGSKDTGRSPVEQENWEEAAAKLFADNCAVCHGDRGKGDGIAAEYLFPRPRDLSSGYFKIRSTSNGELPTDEDLFRTITRGIPGSAMPSFAHLSEDNRKLLVRYVKTLAYYEDDDGTRVNLFEARGQPPPIKVPDPPKKTPELVALGAQVYQKMGCANCHGEQGVGDGPSAPTLVDVWGNPAPPANFTRGIFKGGDTVRDIYLRFTTGMDGSPMPSFANNLTEQERWALAYFVKSLVRRPAPLEHKSGLEIRAADIDRVPLEPGDAAWKSAPPTEIPLMLLWQRTSAPSALEVRALVSRDHVGFLLEWEDPTADGTQLHQHGYSDAVAVMFSLTAEPGPITMGSKEKPVNLWQWRFSRQLDMKRFRDIESVYPNMHVDDYPEARSHYPKKEPGQTPVSPAPEHNPEFLTGWGSGNTLSVPSPRSACEDLNAHGFGTLEPQPPEDQDVEGKGIWTNGRWAVVIRRPRRGRGQDVEIPPGSRIPVAFAVWDGSAGDRDGQKSVTYWNFLLVR